MQLESRSGRAMPAWIFFVVPFVNELSLHCSSYIIFPLAINQYPGQGGNTLLVYSLSFLFRYGILHRFQYRRVGTVRRETGPIPLAQGCDAAN